MTDFTIDFVASIEEEEPTFNVYRLSRKSEAHLKPKCYPIT